MFKFEHSQFLSRKKKTNKNDRIPNQVAKKVGKRDFWINIRENLQIGKKHTQVCIKVSLVKSRMYWKLSARDSCGANEVTPIEIPFKLHQMSAMIMCTQFQMLMFDPIIEWAEFFSSCFLTSVDLNGILAIDSVCLIAIRFFFSILKKCVYMGK